MDARAGREPPLTLPTSPLDGMPHQHPTLGLQPTKSRCDALDEMSTFPSSPLRRLTPSTKNPAAVHALAFSAGTGSYLLTGSADRSVRLWNPTATKDSAKLIQTYNAHGYEVLDLAVSEDNSKFVSVGGDKTVFLWDVATAQTLRRFNGHAGRVNACAFGGEGDSVAVTGSFDGSVKCWDLRSRSDKPIMTFSEAKDSVSSVAVLGGEVYAGSVDGRVRVYELGMGCVDVDVLGASVTSVCPSVDGESYLASSLDSKLRLMDRKTGKCLQTFKAPAFVNETYRVRSTLAMEDAYAVSGGEDGSVFVWDVLSGELRERLWHKEDATQDRGSKRDVVSAVAWNPARKQWTSAGGDGSVVVWGREDG